MKYVLQTGMYQNIGNLLTHLNITKTFDINTHDTQFFLYGSVGISLVKNIV